MSYDFLLTIAIIMLFTKVFGLTSERVHMPQVVCALIAGVLDIDIDIHILRKLIPKFQFQITGMRVECAALDFCCLRIDDRYESNHHAKAQEQRNHSAD